MLSQILGSPSIFKDFLNWKFSDFSRGGGVKLNRDFPPIFLRLGCLPFLSIQSQYNIIFPLCLERATGCNILSLSTNLISSQYLLSPNYHKRYSFHLGFYFFVKLKVFGGCLEYVLKTRVCLIMCGGYIV